MEEKERQQLAEQRAKNRQTVTFVADQEADIATTAEKRAEEDPAWAAVAEAERERRKTLMAIGREEKRLATEIALGTADSPSVAAEERAMRESLQAISRSEAHTAEVLRSLAAEGYPSPEEMADQAERNEELLWHVAETADVAAHLLQDDQTSP